VTSKSQLYFLLALYICFRVIPTLKRWYFNFDAPKVPMYPILILWISPRSSFMPNSSRAADSTYSNFRCYVFLIIIIISFVLYSFAMLGARLLLSHPPCRFLITTSRCSILSFTSPNTKLYRSNCCCMACNTTNDLFASSLDVESRL